LIQGKHAAEGRVYLYMKKLIVCLFTLCLLTVVPASAGVLYNNGPLSGTIAAYNIVAYEVTDSFVISSPATMTSFDFGSWNVRGDVISAVFWAVGTTPFATDVASGTSPVSSVYEGVSGTYNLYTNTVSGLSVPLIAGSYYLSLTSASVPNQHPAWWDENDGPSTAYFTGTGGLIGSNAFDINGGASVPEPGSMGLLGGGILLMLGALRRKIA
jgi:hypothetical protein